MNQLVKKLFGYTGSVNYTLLTYSKVRSIKKIWGPHGKCLAVQVNHIVSRLKIPNFKILFQCVPVGQIKKKMHVEYPTIGPKRSLSKPSLSILGMINLSIQVDLLVACVLVNCLLSNLSNNNEQQTDLQVTLRH